MRFHSRLGDRKPPEPLPPPSIEPVEPDEDALDRVRRRREQRRGIDTLRIDPAISTDSDSGVRL